MADIPQSFKTFAGRATDLNLAAGTALSAAAPAATPPPSKMGARGPSSTASSPPVPPLLSEHDLPGPLSMKRLNIMGTVQRLDDQHGFWAEYGTTLFGRAQVVAKLAPFSTIACALSAAWVWLGGAIPDTIDVLSNSHYRAAVHGRRIRVFNRRTGTRQVERIGELQLTAPARTAVDLASIRDDEPNRTALGITSRIEDLMAAYRVSAQDCLDILNSNPYMKTGPRARGFFEARLPLDQEIRERERYAVSVRHREGMR